MAQDVSVKQYLIGKGHDPSTIGWDNVTKTAKVGGVDFYKPSTIINGSSYDSQQNLDTAYKGYTDKQTLLTQQNKAISDAALDQQRTDTTTKLTDSLLKKFTDTKPATNPAEDQYNQMIAKIMQQMNNPQAVDPYSTPQYAAAQQQSQVAAGRGIRANQEATGASGFGRSTRNTEGAQRIQNDADQHLLTQIVPQIQAQLQNQKQMELQNQMALLNPLQMQQQNSITNARNENTDLSEMIKLIQGQQDSAYDRSPNNPLVKGQMLQNTGYEQQNTLNQYKLDDYPAESKANAEKIKREAELGNLDIETAKFKLTELKDPNSLTNKAARLALKVQEVAAKYAEPQAKAALAQVLKATQQIGAAPYQSELDKKLDQVRYDTAVEQFNQLKNPKPDPSKVQTAESYASYLDGISKYVKDENTQMNILSNPDDVMDAIELSVLSEYEKYKAYKARGLVWDDPIPKQ